MSDSSSNESASEPDVDPDDCTEREAQATFRSGFLLAIAGTFLFALKSIFIKLAFTAGAEPLLLLMLRMSIALPLYIIVLWQTKLAAGKPLAGKPHVGKLPLVKTFALGFLGYYLASYLDLMGLQYITAQLERLTLFTHPAIVAVLAWLFLGEALNRRVILAILLCYAGVMLMYSQEQSGGSNTNVGKGVLLVAAAALSYSLYVIFAKPTMRQIGSRRFTSIAMIGSAVFVGIHFGATRSLDALVTAEPVVYLYGVILAFICTVIPSFMINEAIMRIGATRTAIVGSSGPVLTMLLAIFVLGEPSSTLRFLGMAVAIGGVSLVARKT